MCRFQELATGESMETFAKESTRRGFRYEMFWEQQIWKAVLGNYPLRALEAWRDFHS